MLGLLEALAARETSLDALGAREVHEVQLPVLPREARGVDLQVRGVTLVPVVAPGTFYQSATPVYCVIEI